MTDQELKEIAKQLRHPTGAFGLEVGEKMIEGNKSMILATLEKLPLRAGNRILELGNGNGGHLTALFAKEEQIHYEGLEISVLMQEASINNNEALVAAQRASFSLYNGRLIPFLSNSFQQVFTVNTIYFWEDPEELLREIHRVLVLNGYFVLTFAQKAFMEKLPFVQYGFQLYEPEAVALMAKAQQLKLVNSFDYQEKATSKMGEVVDRTYTIMVFQKENHY